MPKWTAEHDGAERLQLTAANRRMQSGVHPKLLGSTAIIPSRFIDDLLKRHPGWALPTLICSCPSVIVGTAVNTVWPRKMHCSMLTDPRDSNPAAVQRQQMSL